MMNVADILWGEARHSPQHPTKQKLASSARKQSFQGTSNTTTENTQLQERSKEGWHRRDRPNKTLTERSGEEAKFKNIVCCQGGSQS